MQVKNQSHIGSVMNPVSCFAAPPCNPSPGSPWRHESTAIIEELTDGPDEVKRVGPSAAGVVELQSLEDAQPYDDGRADPDMEDFANKRRLEQAMTSDQYAMCIRPQEVATRMCIKR